MLLHRRVVKRIPGSSEYHSKDHNLPVHLEVQLHVQVELVLHQVRQQAGENSSCFKLSSLYPFWLFYRGVGLVDFSFTSFGCLAGAGLDCLEDTGLGCLAVAGFLDYSDLDYDFFFPPYVAPILRSCFATISIYHVFQPPKNWAKKIQEEWKILEKDLRGALFAFTYVSHPFPLANRYHVFQPPKNWAKKIQEEWKILEKDLRGALFAFTYVSHPFPLANRKSILNTQMSNSIHKSFMLLWGPYKPWFFKVLVGSPLSHVPSSYELNSFEFGWEMELKQVVVVKVGVCDVESKRKEIKWPSNVDVTFKPVTIPISISHYKFD
nr:hypothetical protein [Tanacetum cinerariifolium]